MSVLNAVKSRIEARIHSGEYASGSKLPPIRKLMKEMDASFVTVQRAIGLLQEQRLVCSYVGKGTFVTGSMSPAFAAKDGFRLPFIFFEQSIDEIKNYQTEIYCGVQEECRLHGLVDEAVFSQDLEAVLSSEGLAGAITMSVGVRESDFAAKGLPLVYCGSFPNGSGADSATPNYYDGSRQMALHLASRGLKRIFYVDPVGPETQLCFLERKLGYREGMLEAGLEPEEPLRWHRRKLSSEIKGLLSNPPEAPFAIFAANDAMSSEIAELAEDMGFNIPSDICIAGMEDMACARIRSIPLSTVGYDKRELGREAVRLLLRKAGRMPGEGAGRVMLPMKVIPRGSVI